MNKKWCRGYNFIFFMCGVFFLIISISAPLPGSFFNDREVHVLEKAKTIALKQETLIKIQKKKPKKKETIAKRIRKESVEKIDRLLKAELLIKNYELSYRIAEAIYTHAKNADIQPELVVAVMKIESHGRPNVVSSAGAMGLLQVMPFWKKVMDMEQADLLDPDTNIKMGVEVLRRYLKRYKQLERALAAYNGSLGKKKYPDKVLKVYNKIIEDQA